MPLSNKTVHNLANALLDEVIDYINVDERYVEFMMSVVPDAIQDKLGNIDNDLKMDLSMVIMDSIFLYSNKK